jgi:hypothetical protein
MLVVQHQQQDNMNTDRIKQRLGVETSKTSVNTDTYLKINLDGKEKLLPSDEINHIVNVGERFNFERQRSKFYRILGTLNPTMTNSLFNLDNTAMADKFTWASFNYRDPSTLQYRFLDTSYPKDTDITDNTDINYSQAINKFLIEKDGWFGYKNPDIIGSGLCTFLDMEPKRERFSFVPDINPFNSSTQPVKNWGLTITYPKEMDKSHYMVNGGLLMIEIVEAEVSSRNMTAFGVPCLHNLNVGDMVKISGTTGYDGEHVIIRTGLDNGDLKPYYFVIDLPYTGGSISGISRMKRMFGGQESEYYFRKFRKVKTRNTPVIESDDYETYPLAFSQNIFNDKISQFVFNEDIDVSDLTDNLGRPISELYLTIIKTDSNGLFSQISSGIETPFLPELNTSNINTFLLDVPVINKIHNGVTLPFVTHTPLETGIDMTDLDLYGDLVEYNINEVKEIVLADVSHRFNTLNRETNGGPFTYVSSIGATPSTTTINLGPRQEGYFYKAHHLIKIREFSSYIEQGDQFTEGIPDYAINLGDGRYLWRDLLEIGFNESNEIGLNYPFLNGCHYLYNNYCFHVRRQDPFDNWGLFYANFPADPIGERMTDKFTTNSAEDVC